MTTTQRKSAPTADTVEGTSKPIHENHTILLQKIQDLDAKLHRKVSGIDGDVVIYDLICNHFVELIFNTYDRKPNAGCLLFIKRIANLTEKAYKLGCCDEPCFNTSLIQQCIEEEPESAEVYIVLLELMISAYKQGLAKQPYDYRSVI